MHLEELEQRWLQLDQKLERSLALGNELMRRVVMQPAERRMKRTAFWPAVDVVFCIAMLLVGGNFLSQHWQDSRVLIPASILMLSILALLIDSIWQLQRLSELDWTGPVANIQRTLEQLRVARIRQFKWIMLLSPLVGFCALMVGLYWLIIWGSQGQVNFFDRINTPWVMGNYLFGILFVPAGYYLCQWLANRFQHHPWWQSILDGISGKTIQEASQEVRKWRRLQEVSELRVES